MRMLPQSPAKRISYPLDSVVFAAMEQHRVKTAGRGVAQRREIVLRRANEPALLRGANARGRPAEIASASQPYLNEDQHSAIAHDQVYFAEAAAIILVQERQAALLQELRSLPLRLRPAIH